MLFFFLSNKFSPASSTHTRMSKKQWFLLALTVALAGLSLYINKDWFARDDIRIYHRSRPLRVGFMARRKSALPDNPDVDPIIFGFNHRLKLTSVKVVLLSAFQTNKYVMPLWHLISDTNSVPTKDFAYGMAIKGMHPAVQGATPHPLEPDAKYRLFIETENRKLEHDFVPVARAH